MTPTVSAADWFKSRPWIDELNAAIESYVKSVATVSDYDLKEKLESWRENGIVIFEGAVDTAKINSVLSDVEYLVHYHEKFDITHHGRVAREKPCPDQRG